MSEKHKHIPVMLNEVLAALNPQDGETYVDATFGNGGYTEAILKAADCKVIAIDRDPTVLPRTEELKALYGSRFEFRRGQFSDIKALINQPVNGVVFDIGVSSMQLDQAERGFSFSKDAPLDMRMSCDGVTAAEIVNETPEKELADLTARVFDTWTPEPERFLLPQVFDATQRQRTQVAPNCRQNCRISEEQRNFNHQRTGGNHLYGHPQNTERH